MSKGASLWLGIETYLLEVNGPDEFLAASVLDVHLEAAVGLLSKERRSVRQRRKQERGLFEK